MEYRTIRQSNIEVSTIGIGGSHLHELTQLEIDELIGFAQERGVNLIDTAISYPAPLDMLGRALKGKRDNFVYQMHLGMTFPNGQYLRTREIGAVKQGFESQLKKMGTDYTDIGFVHYVDDSDDFKAVLEGGTLDYALELKSRGVIRLLGFASHNTDTCNRFLETGLFDIGMFSINPAYDFDPVSNLAYEELDMGAVTRVQEAEARVELYKTCVKQEVGIMVMKPFGGGVLLDQNRTSTLDRPMSPIRP